MKYETPPSLNLKELPLTTQYQLNRMLNGEIRPSAIRRNKANYKLKGDKDKVFENGLAVRLFNLIREYNNVESVESEEV